MSKATQHSQMVSGNQSRSRHPLHLEMEQADFIDVELESARESVRSQIRQEDVR